MNYWWNNPYWTSQDGTVHYPERGDMVLRHMENCIDMMERNMSAYYDRYANIGQTRGAFTQMIRTSRIYTILQAAIAREASETSSPVARPSKAWGVRGGK